MKVGAYERAMARAEHEAATGAKPTNQLRYLVRWVDSLAQEAPMLQLWWEWHEHGYGHDDVHGEWRDVPVGREEHGK